MRGNAYHLYQQNSISIESPVKLIEMLYEGVLKFASQARRCIENEDIEQRTYYINRTTDIFAELTNSLDYDRGGEIAHYLSGLYAHQIKLLAQANLLNDSTKVDIVIGVARGLLEAWREINQNELARQS